MEIDSCFKIGYIQKTHGLKGEVTIILDDSAPDAVSALESMFVDVDGRMVPFFVEAISVRGVKGFVKFEDIDSVDEAGGIVRRSIYLPKSERPAPASGEFHDDEIVDFTVIDAESGILGPVTGILQAGPNRLVAVDHGGKEVLIPTNGPFITEVDKVNKIVRVALPEGFLEL